MSKITFLDIPKQYKAAINQIKDKIIKSIYSNIVFLYFPFFQFHNDTNFRDDDQNTNNPQYFLYNDLKNYKFITVYFPNISNYFINNIIPNQNATSNTVDVILCVEKKCIIVEKITNEIFDNLLNKLTNEDSITIIKINKNGEKIGKNEEREVNEEIKKFLSHFRFETIKNEFVNYTIPSIAAYLIRRYFYPTEYFEDSSFFYYNQQNKIKEQKIKSKLFNLLYPSNYANLKYDEKF